MLVLTIIWFLVPAAIQTVLLILLLRRRLYRKPRYPFFFSYTLFSVAVTIPRLIFVQSPVQYALVYWSTEVIYGVLAILSLNEVFGRIFFLDYEEHSSLRLALPLTVLGIMAALFVWRRFIYQAPGGAHVTIVRAAFFSFSFGVHSVEAALLILFLLLWWIFVPGWNRYDYGILLGFGFSAIVIMSSDMFRFNAGPAYQLWGEYAPGIGYIAATAIWLHALWPPPDPRPRPSIRFRMLLDRVRRDNEIIRLIHDWLHRRR